MQRRTVIHNLMIAGAVSLLSRRSRADAPPKEQPDFVIRSDVRLVLLDVSVRKPGDGWVPGLNKSNFEVEENGRTQEITIFGNNDMPVTVGILVDNSRSMASKRTEVLNAATTFIRESNPEDEIFVLTFNETVRRGLPKDLLFSGDINQLVAALSRGTPEGRTALNDAVIDGLEQLHLGKRDKKTLVLISDGGDNASRHTRREMLDEVERNLATIYTIGIFDPDDTETDAGLLRRLSHVSGGLSYFPENPHQMTQVCKDIAKDIRTRYTLGYSPSPHGPSLRRISVRVFAPDQPRLVARTRLSYRYADAVNKN
jgi:VWFA-related protein